MLYAIVAEDRPDSLSARLAARPAHLERLKTLQEEGRLILAGPFPAIDSPDPGPAGFSGSLIVAEFDSLIGDLRIETGDLGIDLADLNVDLAGAN